MSIMKKKNAGTLTIVIQKEILKPKRFLLFKKAGKSKIVNNDHTDFGSIVMCTSLGVSVSVWALIW